MLNITISNVNVKKLADELVASGIKPDPILSNGDAVTMTFTNDTDMDLVQRIIVAHDPTPIPPVPTTNEQIELLGMQLAMEKLTNMQTNVQKDEIINNLGAQVAQIKFEIMQLKGGGI